MVAGVQICVCGRISQEGRPLVKIRRVGKKCKGHVEIDNERLGIRWKSIPCESSAIRKKTCNHTPYRTYLRYLIRESKKRNFLLAWD